jgi:hypothetical protein
MLNYPNIDFNDDIDVPSAYHLDPIPDGQAKLCRVVMQKFADEIMGNLHHLGSSIRFFAAAPSAVPLDHDRPLPDSNGHQWPNYYYLKGRSTNARGQEEVVASPLKGALVEMEGSWVIYHNV